MNDPIRVLVCDDIDRDVNALKQAAGSDSADPPVVILPQVRTGAELLAALVHDPDVVLIDNYLPVERPRRGREKDVYGVRLVAEITKARGRVAPPLRILWSRHSHELDIYSFMAFGGHNYADKDAGAGDPALTLDVIRQTVAGERWRFERESLDSEESERRVLRELRLIALLAAGFRTKTIARELGTTVSVISTTTSQLAEAFGLTKDNGRMDNTIPGSALRAGYLYVPHQYWRFAPDDALWPEEEAGRRPRQRSAASSGGTSRLSVGRVRRTKKST